MVVAFLVIAIITLPSGATTERNACGRTISRSDWTSWIGDADHPIRLRALVHSGESSFTIARATELATSTCTDIGQSTMRS
jgi:hypothetical protein